MRKTATQHYCIVDVSAQDLNAHDHSACNILVIAAASRDNSSENINSAAGSKTMGGTFSALLAGGGALADALERQDDQALKEALQANPKLSGCALNMRDGNTASHFAAAEGRLDYLKIVIEAYDEGRIKRGKKHGPKYTARMLNRRNLNGQTTLMLACKYGHSEVVTWLLQIGGNPLLFDAIHSRTCLHYAALYGRRNCIVSLFAADAIVTLPSGPLMLCDATVWDCQGHHTFINARAALGFTALHMAASQGHWQAVTELLKNQASLAVQCQGVMRSHVRSPPRWKPYSTPLHIAAARGSTSMVRHMLHHMANQMLANPETIDIRLVRDIAERRPVDIAAGFGFPRITALLDPARPPELLAYVTAGSGPLKLGAPALSVLMARLLRSNLLDQLVAVETGLASKRAAGLSSSRRGSVMAAASRAKSIHRPSPSVPASPSQAVLLTQSTTPSPTMTPSPTACEPCPNPATASNMMHTLSIASPQPPSQSQASTQPQSPRQQQLSTVCRQQSGPLFQSPQQVSPSAPGLLPPSQAGPVPHAPGPSAPRCTDPVPTPFSTALRPYGVSNMPRQHAEMPRQQNGASCQILHGPSAFATAARSHAAGSSTEECTSPVQPPVPYTGVLQADSTVERTVGRTIGTVSPSNVAAMTSAITRSSSAGSSCMDLSERGDADEGEPHVEEEEVEQERAPFMTLSMRRLLPSPAEVVDGASGRAEGAEPGVGPNPPLLPTRRTDDPGDLPRDSSAASGDDLSARGPRGGAAVTGGASGSYSPTLDSLKATLERLSRLTSAGEPRKGSGDVVFAHMDTRQGPVQYVVSRASNVLTRAPSVASLAAEECDICFDAPLEAAIVSCHHELCVSCLRGVCKADPDHTPRCPFCRAIIDRIVEAGQHRRTHYP